MLRYTVELAFVSILMKRQARLTLDAPPFPTDEASPATGLPHGAADLAPGRPIRHRVRGDPEPARGGTGVVAQGSVGMSSLGRFRLFRCEIRRWRGGSIPDLAYAVSGPSGWRRTSFALRRLWISFPTSQHPCGAETSYALARCGIRTR
jgi:hypothetical protein